MLPHFPSSTVTQLEQAVLKEMAWFKSTALNLEKLKAISLDPNLIAEQLYEQKVRRSKYLKLMSTYI